MKLLILSDAPTSQTGLGRITRELAQRIHADLKDQFEVATLGYGGNYSQTLPWKQYVISRLDNWVVPELPEVWEDFAGDEEGIIFAIWNAGWLPWFVHPWKLPHGELKKFLHRDNIRKWIYCPVDAEGPNGRLVKSQGEILASFDRVLAYTKWGARIIEQSIEAADARGVQEPCQHLPHGIDRKVFFSLPRTRARNLFLEELLEKQGTFDDNILLLGCVATNTPRKDWGLCFEVCAELLRRGENVGLWAHTDQFKKHWDLPTLADEFRMTERTIFTNNHLSDKQMLVGYNACNATLGIGSGEGWGLPLTESLACGIPVIAGDYAAASEIVPREFLVRPWAFRLDGFFASRRPVYNVDHWANKIQFCHSTPATVNLNYDWDNCWPEWKSWLLQGIKK